MKQIYKRILTVLLCSVLCTGCGINNDGTIGDNTNSSQEQNTHVEVEMDIDYSKVASIQIVDVSEDMYEEAMQYDLTTEQVNGFIDVLNDLVEVDVQSGNRSCYRMNLYDGAGNPIDSIEVDSNKCITSSNGTVYEKGAKFEEWLTNVELSLGISLDSVWGRRPSKQYFSLLTLADTASLDEVKETNFDEGLELEISKEDIEELSQHMANVSFSKKAKELDEYKYVIEFFSSQEASLYILYVDNKLNVYTEYGYEISGGGVKDWVKAVINNAKD